MQLTRHRFGDSPGLVHATSGIVLNESKRNLVVSRLSRRLRALDLPDFDAYCRVLEGDGGAEEQRLMTSLLTTNVTKFFREIHHFNALRDEVLPPLLANVRQGGRLRIWSAGCSTGQEPYSLAAILLDVMPDAAKRDARILATDIDPASLAKAREGTYAAQDAEDVPPGLRKKVFSGSAGAGGGALRVNDELREIVTFAELNLMRDWPFRGRFDVIFCRNVVIYFDAETQRRLWSRYSEALMPGGHLFVGHSERVTGSASQSLQPVGITQYRRG
ncbi:MAG: protein-glutamate O-methyltransferase [Roseovarius sp.]